MSRTSRFHTADIISDLKDCINALERECDELEEKVRELLKDNEDLSIQCQHWKIDYEDLENELAKTSRILDWEVRKGNLRERAAGELGS